MNILLENEDLLVVMSTEGGSFERILNKKTNNEHIWKYDKTVWPRRTSICFPICGRLLDNEFVLNNKIFSLPMHGFIREKNFNILYHIRSKVALQVCSDEVTLQSYPYDFILTLVVELAENRVIIAYEIENIKSELMLYSIGSHYSYSVPVSGDETVSNYYIDFHKPQSAGRLLYTDGYISGKSNDFMKGRRCLNLEGLFDNGSVAFDLNDLDISRVTLKSKNSQFQTTVSFENFTHLIFWTPNPTIPFLCIEAWAGIPDTIGHNKELSEKKGVLNLSKGGVRRHVQQIEIV